MRRDQALPLLHAHRAEIASGYGVTRLAPLGATAREDSAVDGLVDFSEPTFRGHRGLKFLLEDVFGSSVALVCDDAVRPRLKSRIEREAIHVA